MTEVDREWFNIKIRDLEDKLARFLKITVYFLYKLYCKFSLLSLLMICILYLLYRALDERHKFEEETIVANECLAKLRSDNEDIILVSCLYTDLSPHVEII